MDRMKVVFGLVVLPFLLAGWPASGPAWGQEAGPTKILVLNPESRVLSPKKLRNLGKHLRSLIKRYPSLEVQEIPSLQFKVLKRKAKCQGAETECLVNIGKQVGVSRLLHSEVQKLPGRYLTVMKLVDVSEGRLLETSRQRARRRINSLRSALLKGWVDLFGPLIRSQIQVSANVSGADVFMDGRNIGKTPLILTKDLGKGEHVIEVTHVDYEPVRETIQVSKGRKLKVLVTLEKKTAAVAVAPPPPPPPPPKEKKIEEKKVEEKKVEEKKVVEEKKMEPEGSPGGAAEPVAKGTAEEKVETIKESQPFLPSFETIGGGERKQEEEVAVAETEPIYKQWWFWTAVGAVVTGGVVGLVVGLSAEEDGIPSGKGRVVIEF